MDPNRLPLSARESRVSYLAVSRLSWLTIIAVGAAALAYLTAAFLYPGGSQLDRTSVGYSHLRNYLCDIFDEHPFGREENPARFFGVTSLLLLSLSLLPLSLNIRHLMLVHSPSRRWVPIMACFGGVSGCLVFTPFHDRAIEFGFALVAAAFLVSLFELGRSGYARLAWLGVWPITLGALNFTLWKFQLLVFAIPFVQKSAILGMMIWVMLVSLVVSTVVGTVASSKLGE